MSELLSEEAELSEDSELEELSEPLSSEVLESEPLVSLSEVSELVTAEELLLLLSLWLLP